ncbi:MAG TPA: adenylate/guanylate cyclase domain-containing protein [Solirubrobacteraceae bacterium]|nr:adenylate/guanylate cyclase domain-containing protein [Solirubrobacteraceae bacterium]
MSSEPSMPPDSSEWQKILTEGHRSMSAARHFWRRVPSAPRCKVCSSPFGGVGGRIVRHIGWAPSRKNPNVCARCCDQMPVGGAEVDVAVLFADVRGSTGLGERSGASEFAQLLNRFYAVATEVILRHDGLIDKLIGDEAMALFIAGVAGPDYRRKAFDAARELLEAVGYGTPQGAWLPVGVGLNAGHAYVGNVGSAVVDFTALGDAVNVAARLQGSAKAGQLVVAGDLLEDLDRRLPRARHVALEVKGRDEPVPVLVADFGAQQPLAAA